MSLPEIMGGIPKDTEASVSSRVSRSAETSATPGTLLMASYLLRESGALENKELPSAPTVTLSE